jgi:hypothetical protein
VIFGLNIDDIGHISPQWRDQALKEISEKATELYKKGTLVYVYMYI